MSAVKPRVNLSKLIEPSVRHRLFKAIQDETSLTASGQVGWSGFRGIDEYVSVLRDAFIFPSAISNREAGAIVWRGILDALKTGNLGDSSVLEALQRITASTLAEPVRKFSMWTRLSFVPPDSAKEILFTYEGVSIRLATRLPSYMSFPESDLTEFSPIKTKDTPGFGFLIARTRARNQSEAADKLFAAAEITQAIYNLALKAWNLMGSEQRPEAVLLSGPYQFMFQERKSLSKTAMWFNPSFRDEFWKSSAGDFDNIVRRSSLIRKCLRKLENHPLKEPLVAAFLMMNVGMESADMTHRTLRYWTALERVFQSGDERVSYDKIIRRATYLDYPSEIPRAKLTRLMRIRNRYVHMGKSENEHHQLTQYLAEEVRSHLFYLLLNGDDFADHAEFIDMTDLPSDSVALQRRRKAIDRRERMIEKRRHRAD